MFTVLAKGDACEPWERFKDDWDERFEPLVNRVSMDDGKDYLELSATGQIFHETFRSRFQESKATNLPLKAKPNEKASPKLGTHAYNQARQPIFGFLERVTELSYVCYCHTTYWNPDLPESTRFRMSGGEIQGIYSNGTWCVKFEVATTATDADQLPVIVADLNDWLDT
ncbi:MAG: hypothetical protein OXU36_14050 [Candidatus Poribacteria bacterium]|nr:hypothetical protein [Candidatus Poribacteria bacterium]